MSDVLKKLIGSKHLTAPEATDFLDEVLGGRVSEVQLAAVLIALKVKGETPAEIVGFIKAMRRHMVAVEGVENAVDVCGTGGDGKGTFNISTATAFVVAGAGAKVAKHGNRAASSQCGSADVLEQLGAKIDLSPSAAKAVLQKTGVVFLFAQKYHPAMKEVAAVRKQLGVPTIFNLLGPFSNPAGVKTQLIGVPDGKVAEKLAQVASRLGYKRLLIASSRDGLDEISLAAPTTIFVVEGGKKRKLVVRPERLGFSPTPLDKIKGGDAARNAAIIEQILAGRKGPHRDIVVLNSAYALYAARLVDTPKQGIARAEASIDSGKAKLALEQFIKETQRHA